MPDVVHVNPVEDALRADNRSLSARVEELTKEVSTLKSKDGEAALAKLQKDVADRDAAIAERDKTITGLNTQLQAVTESSKALEERVKNAELNFETAKKELETVKAAEVQRSREATLREKNAPAEAIATLLENFKVLSDEAFTKTVDTISASWAKPQPAAAKPAKQADPVVAAVQKATVEVEPALATASEDQTETAAAAITDFLGKSMRQARAGRPTVFATAQTDNE